MSIYVRGTSKITANILVVDGSPSATVAQFKEPFCDSFSEKYKRCLIDAGFNEADINFTYAVKVPMDPTYPSYAIEMSWKPVLLAEINNLRPQLIITVGEMATRIVTGSPQPIEELRGKFLDVFGFGKVLPTYGIASAVIESQQDYVLSDLKFALKEYR